MKATFAVAATAALAGSVSAGSIHHRHAGLHGHSLEKKHYPSAPSNGSEECGCKTIYTTVTGAPTLIFPPAPSVPATTSETPAVVPTPVGHSLTSSGVYTFAPSTLTLTESTTVAVPSTTALPSGTHVVGGVTTSVTTATTVTCPYATVETSGDVTTSTVKTTEYVCPTSGVYTIAPITTTVSVPTTVNVPSVTTYAPGTYTQPEITTTIKETNTVFYCPFSPVAPTTTPKAPAPAPEYPTATPVSPTPAPVATPSYVASPAPKPSSSKPETPAPSGDLVGTPGSPYGITYTPYNPDKEGGCMSKDQVNKEIAALAKVGVKAVRTYSTDCNTLEYVGEACREHGIQMIVGVFINNNDCQASASHIAEQISALKKWAQWDIVPLVIVGNEAVHNGYCKPAQIANIISTCKSEFAGYKGKFGTADTTASWQLPESKSALCGVIDTPVVNAHAYFNAGTSAHEAGPFVKGQLEIVEDICGKEGLIGETGWPSAGDNNGLAIAGLVEQGIAIHSIVKSIGEKATLFSYHNDEWKTGTTECSFGIAHVFGITI